MGEINPRSIEAIGVAHAVGRDVQLKVGHVSAVTRRQTDEPLNHVAELPQALAVGRRVGGDVAVVELELDADVLAVVGDAEPAGLERVGVGGLVAREDQLKRGDRGPSRVVELDRPVEARDGEMWAGGRARHASFSERGD